MSGLVPTHSVNKTEGMADFFFDYDLPEHLIAQTPAANRADARLLVVHRRSGRLEHRFFRDLPEYLNAGDLLVRNNTKVLPARLIGVREKTGGRWEGLYLTERDGVWEVLAQTRGFPDVGEILTADGGRLRLELVGRTDDRHWLLRALAPGAAEELLAIHGSIPLPPYIRKGLADGADTERYQTVYAAASGSVAAPTAGLHFTPELLRELLLREVGIADVTLHVGLGTFAPVKAVDPTQHAIHSEWCEVPAETIGAIRHCGGRVFAVGTTTVRALESAARVSPQNAFRGPTDLFIHPPFEFRAVGGLITNFHLPRTTLLLLVQAFSGSELLKAAYAEAVRAEYRFFSYGDAMLVM